MVFQRVFSSVHHPLAKIQHKAKKREKQIFDFYRKREFASQQEQKIANTLKRIKSNNTKYNTNKIYFSHIDIASITLLSHMYHIEL